MGNVRSHRPVLRVVAVFAQADSAFEWFEETSQSRWGAIQFQSDRFPFSQTRYYEREMGGDLRKTLYAFASLMSPESLPGDKLTTNAWEVEYAAAYPAEVERPINIDPGYLTEAKLVLATTKDRDHRLYLSDGIFAEVTLYFHASQWQGRPWTYPDFMQVEYHEFLGRCRDWLRSEYRKSD